VSIVFAQTGEGYVAAAYLVFLGLLLVYLAITATRLARVERELRELAELAARRHAARGGGPGEDVREEDRDGVTA
jgi:hypothetical protein